jgi:DNA-binding response OmpR family regulator
MATLLLAEDDEAIAAPLARALRREGHEVEVAGDGPGALQRSLSGRVDLLILDLGLPGIDGVDVCRRLREVDPDLPVLMLTARADEVDLVVGLDAGADDYVAKPFRLAELLARVRALLRRMGSGAKVGDRVYTAGRVRVDCAARRVFLDDTELTLRPREFELLALLVRHAGSVVSRETIMREVWNAPGDTTSKSLDIHISWLRRKLGDDPNAPRHIVTVRGVGFRFDAD